MACMQGVVTLKIYVKWVSDAPILSKIRLSSWWYTILKEHNDLPPQNVTIIVDIGGGGGSGRVNSDISLQMET